MDDFAPIFYAPLHAAQFEHFRPARGLKGLPVD
jgi:hypothetical protein